MRTRITAFKYRPFSTKGHTRHRAIRFVTVAVLLSVLGSSCASLSGLQSSGTPLATINRVPSAVSEHFRITPEVLARAVEDRMKRIPEFQALKEYGRLNGGLRIWGAGGTATGLAVYVRQELENEWRASKGLPPKYSEKRFSYHYFDVYRSTQDADIIIDGTEAQARALEDYLRSNFNYLQGSKSVWEVRLLNESRGIDEGKKDPLLGYDFQNQNSDSFSTGMIELTTPPKDELRIRDLFDWKNQKDPKFLRDLADGTLTFYRNSAHFQTARASAGMNPEILSVIRVLTKAFQYESEMRPEDEAAILQIIRDFDPMKNYGDYVNGQISKNGLKLFWHSPDVERAWDELERLGLREKLVTFGNKRFGSGNELSVWLEREPLRTKPLGLKGKTAGELGITTVAHETNSFLAYENISRSARGKPNVFISRSGAEGEAAVHGDGFYTRIGKEGARGSGLTIRFTVHPDARRGVDFSVHGDYVIFHNAAAVTVIDESLTLSWVELLSLLESSQFGAGDRGIFEKLKLKLSGSDPRTTTLSPKDDREVTKIITRVAKKPYQNGQSAEEPLSPVLYEWLESSHARNHPELLDLIVQSVSSQWLARFEIFASRPDYSEWFKKAFQHQYISYSTFYEPVIQAYLNRSSSLQDIRAAEKMIGQGTYGKCEAIVFLRKIAMGRMTQPLDFIETLKPDPFTDTLWKKLVGISSESYAKFALLRPTDNEVNLFSSRLGLGYSSSWTRLQDEIRKVRKADAISAIPDFLAKSPTLKDAADYAAPFKISPFESEWKKQTSQLVDADLAKARDVKAYLKVIETWPAVLTEADDSRFEKLIHSFFAFSPSPSDVDRLLKVVPRKNSYNGRIAIRAFESAKDAATFVELSYYVSNEAILSHLEAFDGLRPTPENYNELVKVNFLASTSRKQVIESAIAYFQTAEDLNALRMPPLFGDGYFGLRKARKLKLLECRSTVRPKAS